jgi:hypothetical protein
MVLLASLLSPFCSLLAFAAALVVASETYSISEAIFKASFSAVPSGLTMSFWMLFALNSVVLLS